MMHGVMKQRFKRADGATCRARTRCGAPCKNTPCRGRTGCRCVAVGAGEAAAGWFAYVPLRRMIKM
jgi:hypothetical protein